MKGAIIIISILYSTMLHAQWVFNTSNVECGYRMVDLDTLAFENLTQYYPNEILPQFPGGEDSLQKFINNHLNNNNMANCGEGKVYVQFNIDTLGVVSEIRLRKGYCSSNDLKALQLVSMMPKWIPGIYEGKKRTFRYTLPIIFKQQ